MYNQIINSIIRNLIVCFVALLIMVAELPLTISIKSFCSSLAHLCNAIVCLSRYRPHLHAHITACIFTPQTPNPQPFPVHG